MLFIFQEHEEDDVLANDDRLIQNSRALVDSDHYFFHNVYLLLYIKYVWDGSVVGTRAGNVHDLGSNPRSSHFHYHFPIHVHVQRLR